MAWRGQSDQAEGMKSVYVHVNTMLMSPDPDCALLRPIPEGCWMGA